jgi:hypothetical protein
MRRNNDSNEPATLIPISVVATEVGFAHAPEVVWGRLKRTDVPLDWRYEHSVTPARARQLVDEFRADADGGEEVTRQRNAEHERRLEAENEKLWREAAAARPPSTERVLHGTRVFTPGSGAPEPEWMRGPSTEADE